MKQQVFHSLTNQNTQERQVKVHHMVMHAELQALAPCAFQKVNVIGVEGHATVSQPSYNIR